MFGRLERQLNAVRQAQLRVDAHEVRLDGSARDRPLGGDLGVGETLGDEGDIMLVDLASYLTAVKAGGLRAATSIHLWFDQDLMAFRFILRVAGQPWWSEVTTAANGNFTQSPFVSLAERT